MHIQLHKKAITTPAILDYIRTCSKPVKTFKDYALGFIHVDLKTYASLLTIIGEA